MSSLPRILNHSIWMSDGQAMTNKTSPRSKSSFLSLGSNRRSIGDQPCPRGLGRFNGLSFCKSLQRNVKKNMGCFRMVAGRPKDAKRALPIKLVGNAAGVAV